MNIVNPPVKPGIDNTGVIALVSLLLVVIALILVITITTVVYLTRYVINSILAATVFDCYNVYLWEECTVLCSLCMHIHVHKVYMNCRYM